MSRRMLAVVALGLLTLVSPLLVPLGAPTSHTAPTAPGGAPQHAALQSSYGNLPLAFELNQGQAGASARFLARGYGYTLALTPSAALLALQQPGATSVLASRLSLTGRPMLASQSAAPPTLLGMRWLGANPTPVVTGEQPLPGTVNEFIGNNPAEWHTNIPTYQQVRYHDIYPGIDLVYYGNQGQLEYDFVVAPGASPAAIQLGFTGANRLGVDLAGNLSLALPGGTLQQARPLVYQAVNNARQAIAGSFALTANHRVRFTLGAYNPHLPLVIDPAYKFSTYLGGSGLDQGNGIAVDSAGNAYVTGYTQSFDFPTASPLQGTSSGHTDVFVTKMNASGTALVYSTYLGGSGDDEGAGIAVDAFGNAYLTGYTASTDFPTANPIQAANAGGYFGQDAFITKLDAAGNALVFSTYLGGSSDDTGAAIALDSADNVYIIGTTQSTNFPLATPEQNTYGGNHDAFVAKVNSAGTSLAYSTYLGGSGADEGEGIAVDSTGNAYVTGYTSSPNFPAVNAFQSTLQGGTDAFVARLSAVGTALAYSTYLGGSIGTGHAVSANWGYAIAVDGSGSAYVTGVTNATNFPLAGGVQRTFGGVYDAFVTKLSASGSRLTYSTYLGGSGQDEGRAITLDYIGDAYITGLTDSTDYPVTADAIQPVNVGFANVLITKLNTAGSAILYSSYLGGTGYDYGYGIALNAGRDVYLTGTTAQDVFPTKNPIQANGGGMGDAFVTKMSVFPSPATTLGVFRPSTGVLYLKNANSSGPADITLYYGQPGDQPITGDWIGQGYKTIGVYRTGQFLLRDSNTTGVADAVIPFGASGDIPVAGDWTGKGYDSIGVYRPSNSTFYLRDSNTSGPPDHVVTLGVTGDVPIVGDWTGKGYDSVGVFRPTNGVVYLRNSNTTGVADISFVYGKSGDKPVIGDWTAQGYDTIGVDRSGRFLLRNSNTTGPADISFYLGVSGDDPIAGPWLVPASAPPPVHRGPGAPSHSASRTVPGALPSRRGR